MFESELFILQYFENVHFENHVWGGFIYIVKK